MRILATSREALHVASEVRHPRRSRSARAAVELFLERARAARPGIRAGRRGRRARRARSPGASTDCRSRSSSPPPASTCSGSRELLSILERRAALLHDTPGVRPEPHRAAGARRVELRPPARRREDAAPAARRPPRRRVPRLARRGRRDARPQRGDGRVSARRARRQVDRLGLVRRRRRPLRHARHRPRVRARRASPRAAALAAVRARPRRVLRRAGRRGRSGCAGRNGCAGGAGWSSRTTTSGLRWRMLGRHRTRRRGPARDARVVLRARRARLRGTALPRARARRGGRRRTGRARIELLANLCYLATEELELDAALQAGERALRARREPPASRGSSGSRS